MVTMKTDMEPPSYACQIWHDRCHIYIKLATGLFLKFDKTEGALSKVLRLLEREQKAAPKPAKAKPSPKTKLPLVKDREKPVVTDEQLDRTLASMKKRGHL